MQNPTIQEYLKTLPTDGTVYYCPDLGNAGDSLIAEATLQLFEDVGVVYQLKNWTQLDDFDPQGNTLIYGGGGNLVSYYKVARNIVQKYHSRVARMIIFPHTISENEDLLAELTENTDIILRERVSHSHVEKNNQRSNIMLMDDLAFSLDLERVFDNKPPGLVIYFLLKVYYKLHPDKNTGTIPPLSQIFSNNILRFKSALSRLASGTSKNTLNCFRTDVEGTDIELPADNLDLSDIFAYGTDNKELIHYGSYRLLDFMNNYDEIRTNRLHLCLAGALLGKSVKFYPNSYWKCEAIYEFSIKNRFNNVEWCA